MAAYDLSPLMNGVNNAFNNVIKAKMYSNEMDRKLANDAYNRKYTDARIALTEAQRQGAQQKADIQRQIFSMFKPNQLDERASMIAQNLAGVNLADVARALTIDGKRAQDIEYARQKVAYEKARANNVGADASGKSKQGAAFRPDVKQLFQRIVEGKGLYGNPTRKPEFDSQAFVAALDAMRKNGIPFDNMEAMVALAANTPIEEVARLYGKGVAQPAPTQQVGSVVSKVFTNAMPYDGVGVNEAETSQAAQLLSGVPRKSSTEVPQMATVPSKPIAYEQIQNLPYADVDRLLRNNQISKQDAVRWLASHRRLQPQTQTTQEMPDY